MAGDGLEQSTTCALYTPYLLPYKVLLGLYLLYTWSAFSLHLIYTQKNVEIIKRNRCFLSFRRY